MQEDNKDVFHTSIRLSQILRLSACFSLAVRRPARASWDAISVDPSSSTSNGSSTNRSEKSWKMGENQQIMGLLNKSSLVVWCLSSKQKLVGSIPT